MGRAGERDLRTYVEDLRLQFCIHAGLRILATFRNRSLYLECQLTEEGKDFLHRDTLDPAVCANQ